MDVAKRAKIVEWLKTEIVDQVALKKSEKSIGKKGHQLEECNGGSFRFGRTYS